jgi:hypothetical protein
VANYHVVGINETVKQLRTIDKSIVNDARKDLRTGVQPVVMAIKANIPSQAPLRGMIHNGRTGWNPAGVPVKTKTDFSKRAQKNESSLVSIVVGGKGSGSAAFQIADMAGKKSSSGRSQPIKPYAYKGGTRTHTNNGQGRAMIRALSAKARASRYAWPAALREIPFIEDVVNGTIKKLTETLNERLKER